MTKEKFGKAVGIVVATTVLTAFLMLGSTAAAAFLAWDINVFSRLADPFPQRLGVLLWLVALFMISRIKWEGEGEK